MFTNEFHREKLKLSHFLGQSMAGYDRLGVLNIPTQMYAFHILANAFLILIITGR